MEKFSSPLTEVPVGKTEISGPSQLALSYEHLEHFTKDSEVRRDLENRASVILVFYKRSDWFAILDYSALVKSNQWF